jgi:hypothetical protein
MASLASAAIGVAASIGLFGFLVRVEAESSVFSSDANLNSQTVGSVVIGRNAVVNATNVEGTLVTGRDLVLTNSKVNESAKVGRDATIADSVFVGGLTVGRNALLEEVECLSNLAAGANLQLKKAHIKGDVQAHQVESIESSTIDGTLFTHQPSLTVHSSMIQQVVLDADDSSGIHIAGTSISSAGRGHITLGNNSTVHANGLTILSKAGQTSVFTPDGSIYVNGKRVQGAGPANFSEYRASHPNIPGIDAPGWVESTVSVPISKKAQETLPSMTLELTGNTQVTGNVEFKNGFGNVILRDSSKIGGRVINGKVKEL